MAFIAFVLTHCACCLKCLSDLIVQFSAIGDNDERPIARDLSQYLLREEDHGQALAGTLCLPKHTAASVFLLSRIEHRRDGVVDAQHLMILSKNLDQPALVLREKGEVFDEVQEAHRLTSAAKHRFERNAARFI